MNIFMIKRKLHYTIIYHIIRYKKTDSQKQNYKKESLHNSAILTNFVMQFNAAKRLLIYC